MGFVVRMEDLDPVTSSPHHAVRQLGDLGRLGIDHDGEVVRQSERFERYQAAIDELSEAGLVYRCYCTRREIAAEIAASVAAPHDSGREATPAMRNIARPDGAYPGTCRRLSAARRRAVADRPAALRLSAGVEPFEVIVDVDDAVLGRIRGVVDDLVLRRGDGVPAYNLAVVVDDAAQGVTQVVRGDDLASSTPRQVHLQRLLGLPTPTYVHVPLVLSDGGERLAKRHGAVTLDDLGALGVTPQHVVSALAASFDVPGAGEARSAGDLLAALAGAALDPALLRRPAVRLGELSLVRPR